jgi:hypothetical protein
MWILFGNKMTTERVPNGKRVERHCDSCGETAMFYERVASTKLSLYFIELLEYGKRRVMACGACGELYATDELGAAEVSTPEKVIGAAEKAGAQIGAAAKDAFGKLKSGLDQFRSEQLPPSPREPERELSDDPLAEEENELEKKFRDLETRYRVK